MVSISNEPPHACGIIIYNAHKHELFFPDDKIVAGDQPKISPRRARPLGPLPPPPLAPALGQYMVYWNTLYLGHNSAVDCTISGWILREDEKIRGDQKEWNEYCLWKKNLGPNYENPRSWKALWPYFNEGDEISMKILYWSKLGQCRKSCDQNSTILNRIQRTDRPQTPCLKISYNVGSVADCSIVATFCVKTLKIWKQN